MHQTADTSFLARRGLVVDLSLSAVCASGFKVRFESVLLVGLDAFTLGGFLVSAFGDCDALVCCLFSRASLAKRFLRL